MICIMMRAIKAGGAYSQSIAEAIDSEPRLIRNSCGAITAFVWLTFIYGNVTWHRWDRLAKMVAVLFSVAFKWLAAQPLMIRTGAPLETK